MILIIDFGSQSTHLISRRLRELSIKTKIILPEDFEKETIKYDGIILSGGPSSVYETGAPLIDKNLFELGKPILGICYGEQLMAHVLDGQVDPGKKKEYGPAVLKRTGESGLFIMDDTGTQLPDSFNVWMSHGDHVVKPPSGFKTVGVTDTIAHAAIANEEKKQYGIQFHPEVVHTQFGMQILKNFAEICGLKPKEMPISKEFVDQMVVTIHDSVKDAKVIGAMSGGVDSSIACLLVHSAIGENFTPIYIDSGLMRAGETEELEKVFKTNYKMPIKIVNAAEEFLKNLEGVTDPEKKRKIIGKTFIDVLDREAKKLHATFLVQGTIYPDVIESAGTKHSHTIKSHHNVGGLPPDMKLTLLEPLRNFYKDEVRKIGNILNLPESITHRHPFPGPGLAIRIIGAVTKDKIEIVKKADKIVEEEIRKAGWYDKLWQELAVLTGTKSVGVRGDMRAYGETIAIRVVQSIDVMSSNFAHLPYELLEKMSVRIVTEIPEVNRVVYDITNKPPATIEWE